MHPAPLCNLEGLNREEANEEEICCFTFGSNPKCFGPCHSGKCS